MTIDYRVIRLMYDHPTNPVYEVEYQKKSYVLKKYEDFVHSRFGISPEILDELLVYSNFHHPHIVNAKKIWVSRGNFYFLLEKMDGDLTDLITSQTDFSPTIIRNWLEQLLLAINALHQGGLIYNDLKPQNIGYQINKKNNLNSIPTLKLLDFGLTSSIQFPYYRYRQARTTYHYTPPEYLEYRETGRISVNADIFSLGVIFYYLLQPATYLERDQSSLFDPSQIDSSVIKKKIGITGYRLLMKMLTLDPDQRITALEALADNFFEPDSFSNQKQQVGGQPGISLPTRSEYKQPTNQDLYLSQIAKLNLVTPAVFPTPSLKKFSLSSQVTSRLRTEAENYRPLTLNYAYCLFYRYLQKKKLVQKKLSVTKLSDLTLICLQISIKICEHNTKANFKKAHWHQLELDILKTLDYHLPLPVWLSLDTALYYRFLQTVYATDQQSQFPPVTLWAKVIQQATNIHASPTQMMSNKEDLIDSIISSHF